MKFSRLIISLLLILACSSKVIQDVPRHIRAHVQDQLQHTQLVNVSKSSTEESNQNSTISREGLDFNIVVDYSEMKTNSTQHHDYISKILMPAVADYFRATLKLKYPTSGSLIPYTHPILVDLCNGVTEEFFTKNKGADLVIVIKAHKNHSTSTIATTSVCFKDAETHRPIVTQVDFNTLYLNVIAEKNPHYNENLYTLLHEVIHALGFGKFFLDDYLLPNGSRNYNATLNVTRNGRNVTLLATQPLVTRLRKFYGCETIQGGVLESRGGPGSVNSHFDGSAFRGEVMVPTTGYDQRLSELSLAVLEGTGWYFVDYSRAEPYNIGIGQGCGFYNGNEYRRVLSDDLCSNSSSELSNCSNPRAVRYADFIPGAQSFGPESGSKCFTGTLAEKDRSLNITTQYCFTFKCKGMGTDMTLDVTIGNTTKTCYAEGPITVEGYSGELNCPHPLSYCSRFESKYCPRGCMGRGVCREGKCECSKGFTGNDCAWPEGIVLANE